VQKTANRTLKGRLLERKRRPFATHWKSTGYEGHGKPCGAKAAEALPGDGGNDRTGMQAAACAQTKMLFLMELHCPVGVFS